MTTSGEEIIYPAEPERDGGLLVAPEVEVDDDDGEEGRECDQDHVETEVRT